MLEYKTDLRLSHAKYSDDLSFLKNIKSEPPDMILLNDSGSLNVERILEFASLHPKMMELRIVVVRLWGSVIDIYDRQISDAGEVSLGSRRIIARSQEDLFNTVLSVNL